MLAVVMSTYQEVQDGTPPHYRDSTLARAIDSVMAQRFAAWDLWVVADSPPPPAMEQIEALLASYDEARLHLLLNTTPGARGAPGSMAKRFATDQVQARYLAFLDADNAWMPGFLSAAMRAFEGDPTLDLVYCDTLVQLRGDAGEEGATFPWPTLPWIPLPMNGALSGQSFEWRKPDWNEQAQARLRAFNFIDTSDAVMRLDAYAAAGGVQNRASYDWRLWRTMLDAGHDHFQRVPEIGLMYTTSTLEQHQQQYWASVVTSMDLPPFLNLDLITSLFNYSRDDFYQRKYEGDPGAANG